MKTSKSKLITLAAAALLLLSFSNTQLAQQGDAGIPLVPRVMGLIQQVPPEAFPPISENRPRIVRKGLFAHSKPIFEVESPDGKAGVGTSDGSLYVREHSTDAKNIIAHPEKNWRWDVEGARWSTDGKKIAVRMTNDDTVPQIPIVDSIGKNEEVSMIPYSRVGQAIPQDRLFIVNAADGSTVRIDHNNEDPYFHILDWNADGGFLYFLSADRLTHRLTLFSADAKTGKTKKIFAESNVSGALWWSMLHGYNDRMASKNLVKVLADGSFIWTSERTGFAQLYLYDRNGSLKSTVTMGKDTGFLSSLVDVDEKSGFAYAVMQGADDESPYDQALYRFSLANDSKAQKLSDGPSVMFTFLSEDKKKVFVHRSGFPNTLEIISMNADGSNKSIVWSPDLSFFKEYGFSPEIVHTLASDGKTKLRSLILKPKEFDPTQSYPVLESIYGGPNSTVIDNIVPDPEILELQELANQGFVVVMTDGRGTPGRGREFQDFSKGKFGQIEIADHAEVLRSLGKTRKYMDLSRVGVFGHSWGGYFTLRALLQEPDLYKAGVMMSPVASTSNMRVAAESFMGCLPVDCAETYSAGDSFSGIGKLSAPVLIIHGTADDDIPLSESLKLVDQLQKAGKEHQFIILPGVDHIVQRSPVTFHETIKFFQKQLLMRR